MDVHKKVSIVLPVYNGEQFLSTSIEAVMHQTYCNIELIIINDGSTDKSLEIIRMYTQENNLIKYENIDNQGVSNARNIGIQRSSGDFIIFLDVDDQITNNYVEKW